MDNNNQAMLIKLSDTTLTCADPNADLRGRAVIDSSGTNVGEVDDLFIDDREHHVRFLRVASGGFLGLGAAHFLIPVEAITRVDADRVAIDQSRERLASAPQYDPELVEDTFYENLYSYYGYSPYWMTPGIYPGLPFFGM